MKTEKMSLSNLRNLSRKEMKNVMAGSGSSSWKCTCGTSPMSNELKKCSCIDYCEKRCTE